jgi:hypothetical protein
MISVMAGMPRDILGSFREPAPYLAFDLMTILSEFLFFETLARNYQTLWLDTYFFVFLFFCLSIFLKGRDPVYLSGLLWIKKKQESEEGTVLYLLMLILVYFVSPVVLGGFAYGSLLSIIKNYNPPAAWGVPVLLMLICVYPVIFAVFPWRRARAEIILDLGVKKTASLMIRIISGAGIFLLSFYMLAFVYYNMYRINADTTLAWYMRPIVLIMMGFIFTFIYLPARLHYFFDSPEDRGNRAWFILTVISLAVFSMTGLDLF